MAISSITLGELSFGAARSSQPERNQAALEQFLLPLEVLGLDDIAASCHGYVRAALERAGTPIRTLDTLIASHALSINATVVTNNVREFTRVTKLRVENGMA